MRRRYLAAVLAAALTVSACDDAGPLATEAARGDAELAALLANEAGGEPRGHGGSSGAGLFDQLAGAIPGFGGLYRTAACTVVVVLTDMSQAQHAVELVTIALNELVGRGCGGSVSVSAAQGQFSYGALLEFLGAAQALTSIPGVAGVHVSYSLNKVVVLIRTREAAARVLEALPQLGIPADAIAFQGTGGGGGR